MEKQVWWAEELDALRRTLDALVALKQTIEVRYSAEWMLTDHSFRDVEAHLHARYGLLTRIKEAK